MKSFAFTHTVTHGRSKGRTVILMGTASAIVLILALAIGIELRQSGGSATSQPPAAVPFSEPGLVPPAADELQAYRRAQTAPLPSDGLVPPPIDELQQYRLSQQSSTEVIGGRLGGLNSADGPTDAATRSRSEQVTGPGESRLGAPY